MSITKEFMEAVQSGRLIRVRIMLKDSLLVDPTAAQFDDMAQYAEANMDNLYDAHNGESLNYDVSDWNETYLNAQMVAVVNNFSRERIDLLKSMVRNLYREKAAKIKVAPTESNSTTHAISRKQAGAGIAVTGAVLTVAGVCVSQTALTIGGVAVAIAGAALYISDAGNV